jgi:hypothetical protein
MKRYDLYHFNADAFMYECDQGEYVKYDDLIEVIKLLLDIQAHGLSDNCPMEVEEDMYRRMNIMCEKLSPNSVIDGRPTDSVRAASAYCGPGSNRPPA